MRSAMFIVLVGLTTGFRSAPAAGITFVSDPSWQAFAMNADGTMGPALGVAQYETWSAYGANLTAIPGAGWIWMPGVDANSPADLQGAYFTKQLSLPGSSTGGEIYVAVDDYAEVIVNGLVVGTTGSVTNYSAAAGAQGALVRFDLSGYLLRGTNTFLIKAQNGPSSFTGGACDPCTYARNPAGVVFGGTLQYDVTTSAARGSWGQLKIHYIGR